MGLERGGMCRQRVTEIDGPGKGDLQTIQAMDRFLRNIEKGPVGDYEHQVSLSLLKKDILTC